MNERPVLCTWRQTLSRLLSRQLTRIRQSFVPTFLINYMPRFARHVIAVGTDASP